LPVAEKLFADALVENCRQEGVDPEACLIDIIARLPDHPMKSISELLPRHWKNSRVPPLASDRLIPSRQSTHPRRHRHHAQIVRVRKSA